MWIHRRGGPWRPVLHAAGQCRKAPLVRSNKKHRIAVSGWAVFLLAVLFPGDLVTWFLSLPRGVPVAARQNPHLTSPDSIAMKSGELLTRATPVTGS